MSENEKNLIVPFIKGASVNLLPVNLENIDLYFKWVNHQKMRMFSRNEIPHTKEEIKKWFEPKEGSQKSMDFEVWHKKDEKIIGMGGLNLINFVIRKANLWMEIGEFQYWSKGLASEAVELLLEYGFNELNLHKIYAGIFEPNIPSWKCAERVGFKLEGKLKKSVYVEGKYYDERKYKILKEEWQKKTNLK
ncbi:MAG: Spermidine N(1)-acetyltransferase [Promethearchaeota archaeon]|nr:MAG: Spermidine N(1)-acetyltransferase [Candidatus Lokiarchaeota archaeon]